LESKINLSKKKIEKIYTHYIGKSYGGKKFYIIALELYKFHLEKKKDLKEIYDIYKSKESIEKLLSDLLEKECLSLKSFLKKWYPDKFFTRKNLMILSLLRARKIIGTSFLSFFKFS